VGDPAKQPQSVCLACGAKSTWRRVLSRALLKFMSAAHRAPGLNRRPAPQNRPTPNCSLLTDASFIAARIELRSI
jgi:hypothetical protein